MTSIDRNGIRSSSLVGRPNVELDAPPFGVTVRSVGIYFS